VTDQEREADRIADLVSRGEVSHSRMGRGLWRDVVWVYGRDSGSPSGVKLVAATIEPLLGRARLTGRLSPLSPVEPR
jgi:hypothetical protein